MATSRKLSPDSLNAYADRYITLADGADYKRLKLVDDLTYVDQVRDELRKRMNDKEVTFVSPEVVAAQLKTRATTIIKWLFTTRPAILST